MCIVCVMFAELNSAIGRLGSQKAGPRVSSGQETSDASDDETDGSGRRQKRVSRKRYTLKKSHATSKLASLFVTGASNAAENPGSFFCRLCRKDISIAAKGAFEIRRHFQGHKHLKKDQRYRLETPGWRVLGLDGLPMDSAEVERMRSEITCCPLVTLDDEYPFAEDLIEGEGGKVDPKLPILSKVASLISALQLGGPYELVQQLWTQFRHTQSARHIEAEVSWNRDEVLVSNLYPSLFRLFHSFSSFCFSGDSFCLRCFSSLFSVYLVNYLVWNAAPNPVSRLCLDQELWTIQPRVRGSREFDVGICSYVGRQYIPACLDRCVWALPWGLSSRVDRAGQSVELCGGLCFSRVSFWWI